MPIKRRKKKRTHVSRQRIYNSETPKVSVVIPVMNERKTLAKVISQARRVDPQTEIIVVANGSSDGSGELAKKMGAKVLRFKHALGHDVGRSIGAKAAKGNIILFMDGDIIIPAEKLKPFVGAIQRGVDVALNKYMGPNQNKKVHKVVLSKYALNILLSRPDLKGASLTTIPHAISKKAVEVIGAQHLSIPPKAHAIAVLKGLKLTAEHYINVGKTNLRRRRGGHDPVGKLIVGDHLEAIQWVLNQTDHRGGRSDHGRKRELVRG